MNGSAPIRYLRACYESDNREASLGNLLDDSVRHQVFLAHQERLLSGIVNRLPLADAAAAAATKESRLYRREKSLLYCAFLIVGNLKGTTSRLPRKLCAPVLYYPATVSTNGDTTNLEIDSTQQRVNVPVLSALATEETISDADIDALIGDFPQPPFAKDGIQALMSLLMDFIPRLDALPLAQFPHLDDESDIRKHVKKMARSRGRLVCIPACVLALVPNSPGTRGVLFELAEIADMGALSRPLQTLLGCPPVDRSSNKSDKAAIARVPAVLSRAQQGVLASSASAPLTLVIGPPGTGKSYTIAAAAIDHLSRNESVLIACRKHQAVDVLAVMIQELLGPNQCVIRGGRQRHHRELKSFLERILRGIGFAEVNPTDPGEATAEKEMAKLDELLDHMERTLLAHFRDEIEWGQRTNNPPRTFFGKLHHRWRMFQLKRRLAARSPAWEQVEDYEATIERAHGLTRKLLQHRIDERIASNLQRHRRDLTSFLQSLRSRSSTRQQELFATVDRDVLFGTFPIWLTTVADASEIIPLEKETFDVAILDEATQCDMASCLPIFQRAKRAVVVGDPSQLRHISFLSRERMKRLAEECGLDAAQASRLHYREKSVLDLVDETIDTQKHVHFLDEHFRSTPQIIGFSNDKFYNGALSLMRLHPKTARMRSVFCEHIADGKKEGGANAAEATAVIARVLHHVESQAALPDSAVQTLGILSPFRDQVDLIGRLLQEKLPLAAFDRHRIRVGTAHAFQGDERDVMLLSLVVDNAAHPSSLRFLNHPNQLNVTLTRARHQQYLFHSIDVETMPVDSLLREYFAFVHRGHHGTVQEADVKGAFLNDVQSSFSAAGFHTWPEYELAGQLIDLVIEKNDATSGIDLIGCPGQHGTALDLERYRILRRAGFSLFPLPISQWKRDRAACIAAIDSWLDAHGELGSGRCSTTP